MMRLPRFPYPALLPVLALVLCLGAWPSPSSAATPSADGLSAAAPAPAACSLAFARDGEQIVAALTVHINSEYHAYAHDAGDTGRPTTFSLTLAGDAGNGSQPVRISYPPGRRQRDVFDPAATVMVYEGDFHIFASLPHHSAGKAYTARLELLLCSATQCLPHTIDLSGSVPTLPPPVGDKAWAGQWQAMRHAGPAAVAPAARTPKKTAPATLPPLEPRYDIDGLEVASLWQALLFGLLAGLLLNFMPCVLPVVTLKASALLAAGGNARGLRWQNASFCAGILAFFTLLAVALAASGAIWGRVFQSQLAVLCLLLVVFALAMSLFGLFTLPVIDLKMARQPTASGHACLRAFVTGMLATLLATPCSGPFLGGVLAWSHARPLPEMTAVFWAIGLGMGLPVLALALWPGLGRFFPRPGPWLAVFEKVMAFLLLGSALWLLSVLPDHLHVRVLTLLLLLALALWGYGRLCQRTAGAGVRRLVAALCLVVACAGVYALTHQQVQEAHWQEYSPETFAARLGTRPMLLEFTADWCPNCKFLENTVLTPHRLLGWRRDYDIDLVRVDITSPDAPGLALLHALGGRSIPLAAIFPAGDGAHRPLVIRDVYGVERMERALRQATGQH